MITMHNFVQPDPGSFVSGSICALLALEWYMNIYRRVFKEKVLWRAGDWFSGIETGS